MTIKPVVIRFWNGSRHILSEISEGKFKQVHIDKAGIKCKKYETMPRMLVWLPRNYK